MNQQLRIFILELQKHFTSRPSPSIEWTTGVDIWFLLGLFHKAIVQSGGMNCPWGYRGHLRSSIHYFKKHGYFRNVREDVALDVLRMVQLDYKINWTEYPVSSNYNIQTKNMSDHSIFNNLFDFPWQLEQLAAVALGPSLETDKEGAFIPETPEILLEKATPVPILAGITELGFAMFDGAKLKCMIC